MADHYKEENYNLNTSRHKREFTNNRNKKMFEEKNKRKYSKSNFTT